MKNTFKDIFCNKLINSINIKYKLNKYFILKMEKSKRYINEIKTLHCNICNSNLILKYLNQFQRIVLCSNKKVIYIINLYFII